MSAPAEAGAGEPTVERYFASDATPREGAEPRWIELDALAPISFLAGLEFRPVLGDDMLVSFVAYEPGTSVPAHSHEEEQITFVLEGELELTTGGRSRILTQGHVVHLPSGVLHSARSLHGPCRAVDIFTPPRRVLVERMAQLGLAPSPPA